MQYNKIHTFYQYCQLPGQVQNIIVPMDFVGVTASFNKKKNTAAKLVDYEHRSKGIVFSNGFSYKKNSPLCCNYIIYLLPNVLRFTLQIKSKKKYLQLFFFRTEFIHFFIGYIYFNEHCNSVIQVVTIFSS